MDAARFPAVSGEALDGTPFVAPRDLAAGRTVALVAFALEHRAELDTWVPYLDALARSRAGLRARLFLGIGVPTMMRGAIVAALKAAVGRRNCAPRRSRFSSTSMRLRRRSGSATGAT